MVLYNIFILQGCNMKILSDAGPFKTGWWFGTGPVRVGNGKWIEGNMVSHLSLRGHGFKQRTRWWVKVLKETLRHQGVTLQMEYGKPKSQSILMHTGVIAVPWDQTRLDLVDRWLLSCSTGTFRRQSKAIDSLPIAVRNEEFPIVPITTIG